MLMSPNRVITWSTNTLKVTGPLALLMLVGWMVGLVPDSRRMLVLYMTLLLVCVGAACVAMLATCHMAIHKAFSAGYQTGQASVWPQDEDTRPRPADDPVLRLVE